MNPVTSLENPTTPATPTPASPYNTNKPAINALSNITRQLAQQHALIAQHHTITQQTIAEPTKTQQLHRKLQYLTKVLKSRREALFSHKMI